MPAKKNTLQERRFRELRDLAEQNGIGVRCERLARDSGYRVRSGGCRVNGKRWVIVDRTLPASDRLDLLAEEIREWMGADSAIPADFKPFLRRTLAARGSSAGGAGTGQDGIETRLS